MTGFSGSLSDHDSRCRNEAPTATRRRHDHARPTASDTVRGVTTAEYEVFNATSESVGLRKTPRQTRSRSRVDSLVRALLELVDEPGSEPSRITTTDVARRGGFPIGSLYEYFEDLDKVVDAAVAYSIRRHTEILDETTNESLADISALMEVLIASYARLYGDDPALLSLRTSTLFQPHHRAWVRDHLQHFIRTSAAPGSALEEFAARTDLMRRLGLFVAVSETVLRHAHEEEAEHAAEFTGQCLELLRSTMHHVAD